jgi:hypothetical protein
MQKVNNAIWTYRATSIDVNLDLCKTLVKARNQNLHCSMQVKHLRGCVRIGMSSSATTTKTFGEKKLNIAILVEKLLRHGLVIIFGNPGHKMSNNSTKRKVVFKSAFDVGDEFFILEVSRSSFSAGKTTKKNILVMIIT